MYWDDFELEYIVGFTSHTLLMKRTTMTLL